MNGTSDRDSAARVTSDTLTLDSQFDPVSAGQWTTLAAGSLGESGSLDALVRNGMDGYPVAPLYYDRPASRQPDASVPAQALHWDNRLQVLGDELKRCKDHLTTGLDGGIHSFSLDLPELGLGVELNPDRAATAQAGAKVDSHSNSKLDSIAAVKPALDTLLEGVFLDLAPVHLIPGDAFLPAGEALLSLFDEREYDSATMAGSLGADPFTAALKHEDVQSGYKQALAEMAGFIQANSARYPGLRYARVDVVCHHDSGATPVQEIVAAIATAVDYLDALLDAGIALAPALNAVSFNVACDADLVSNIVKLRSLKRLWAHTVSQLPQTSRRGNTTPVNGMAHIDAHTSHRMLSTLDPWVNHLRNVTATSAAAIAGSNSITVHPHDLIDGHRVGNDPELADRVARNLPIVLAEESLLTSVVDPTAGSYAFEHLTEQMSTLAWSELGALQQRGGLLAVVEDGTWIQALNASHQRRVQRLIDSDDLKIGVNHQRPAGAAAIDADLIGQTDHNDAIEGMVNFPRRRESSLFEAASA